MKIGIHSMRQQYTTQSEQGLTLMEALVAILMVSAVMVAITPPIFLAVATRVQNSRAEQAIQLAHGEIDQVRVLVEQGITSENKEQLPASAGPIEASKVPPPSSAYADEQSTNSTCSDYDDKPKQVPVNQARLVDINSDCKPDFLVQTFRTNEQTITRGGVPVPLVFQMGVRVYSISAQNNLANLKAGDNGNVKAASLQLTTGEGQQTDRPLAVLYTALGQGDATGALGRYECFASGTTCTP
jgi:type II secretory pathway pseudopilin PulG